MSDLSDLSASPSAPLSADDDSDGVSVPRDVTSEAADVVLPADGQLDLDRIERDLADVEIALGRLDSGEYWTDEVTGAHLPDEHLVEHPTARRLLGR